MAVFKAILGAIYTIVLFGILTIIYFIVLFGVVAIISTLIPWGTIFGEVLMYIISGLSLVLALGTTYTILKK